MENIIVDSISNLWVFSRSKMDYEEWGELFCDDLNKFTRLSAWYYNVKVNALKKMPSGNYKVTAEIEGDLYPTKYIVDMMLDESGNIIKIKKI